MRDVLAWRDVRVVVALFCTAQLLDGVTTYLALNLVSQQFAATGNYSDGSTNDLTTQVTWASSNTVVATIDTNGLATALSPGTTLISASLTGSPFTLQIPLARRLESDGLWRFASFTNAPTNGQPNRVIRRVAASKIRYAVLCFGVPLKISPDPDLSEPVNTNLPPQFRRDEVVVERVFDEKGDAEKQREAAEPGESFAT